MAKSGRLTWLDKARLVIATSVVTAALTSAYWVIAYDLFGFNRATEQATKVPAASDARAGVTGKSPNSTQRQPAKRVAIQPVTAVRYGSLAIPVVGVKARDLRDTFSDARGEGLRVHDAIDIMAPLGTPVIAEAPGTVEKIWESDKGGHTVYVRALDRRTVYYYAHLDAYAATLQEGLALKAGDPIGTVGYSGNASPSAPHLHFAVMQTQPGESWSKGIALNPYPLLTGAR